MDEIPREEVGIPLLEVNSQGIRPRLDLFSANRKPNGHPATDADTEEGHRKLFMFDNSNV